MAGDYYQGTRDPHHPETGRIQVVFPGPLTLRYYKYSLVRYENLRAAKHVLENVQRIFKGVRAFQEGGWCYTGQPSTWCVKEGVWVPFPKTLIFAVYVNPLLKVYECRAERVSTEDDPLNPQDWRSRYEGLIWKSTSSKSR